MADRERGRPDGEELSKRERVAALLAHALAEAVDASVPLTGWGEHLADQILEITGAES